MRELLMTVMLLLVAVSIYITSLGGDSGGGISNLVKKEGQSIAERSRNMIP